MSRYSRLLTKIIAESGYTAKEIVDKCNKIGNGIDTTRLSKLQNGKLPAPSDKVSRDISYICNVDERQLIIEGYIEKAPNEIVDTFITLKNTAMIAALKMFQNDITKEQIEIMKEELEKEPLSDFVIEILDSKTDEMSLTSTGIDIHSKDFHFQLDDPISIKVEDNAMFPIIPKNSKISIKIEKEYNSGDILVIKTKKDEKTLIRYVLLNNTKIVLTALNKDFKTITYNTKDIIILGKVARVITNI